MDPKFEIDGLDTKFEIDGFFLKTTSFLTRVEKINRRLKTTPLGIEPRISGSVDQRLIHWAMESSRAL